MIHKFIDAMLRDRASALFLGFTIGSVYATFAGLMADRDIRDEAREASLRSRLFEAECDAARAAQPAEATP